MTAHVIVESMWSTASDARCREWFVCACGATWMARTDKPGKCPNDKRTAVAHNHRTIIPGCFRCDLAQDEIEETK